MLVSLVHNRITRMEQLDQVIPRSLAVTLLRRPFLRVLHVLNVFFFGSEVVMWSVAILELNKWGGHCGAKGKVGGPT